MHSTAPIPAQLQTLLATPVSGGKKMHAPSYGLSSCTHRRRPTRHMEEARTLTARVCVEVLRNSLARMACEPPPVRGDVEPLVELPFMLVEGEVCCVQDLRASCLMRAAALVRRARVASPERLVEALPHDAPLVERGGRLGGGRWRVRHTAALAIRLHECRQRVCKQLLGTISLTRTVQPCLTLPSLHFSLRSCVRSCAICCFLPCAV